ncbi:MauE/DoxX family redox-associated membrane protein [Silvibacterium sp.]|uniref:MauE/DoxX family redox-associated membrane protein n=1 Tax=Silvibacterium sp. TaxID=1964179 RepID=UPI0039E46BAB
MVREKGIADERLAYGLLRALVGLNLLMHGASRILGGVSAFSGKMQAEFAHSVLPPALTQLFFNVLPPVEALLGALLLVGLRTRAALVAAMVWMMVLTFGSSLIQDWQAASIQIIYGLVYAALLALHRFDRLSVDRWIGS